MIVVPKRKHDKIVEGLKTEAEEKVIEAETALIQRDSYKEAYEDAKKYNDSILRDIASVEKEKNLLKVSMERKDDNICKLEFKIEQLNERLKDLQRPVVTVTECRCQIDKYEYIAKRTKKTRTREKAYSMILERTEKK